MIFERFRDAFSIQNQCRNHSNNVSTKIHIMFNMYMFKQVFRAIGMEMQCTVLSRQRRAMYPPMNSNHHFIEAPWIIVVLTHLGWNHNKFAVIQSAAAANQMILNFAEGLIVLAISVTFMDFIFFI